MLHFDHRLETGTALVFTGHIDHVLKGHLPAETGHKWLHAHDFAFGFMGGSPKGVTSIGELFVVGGTAYAKSTDLSDHRYYDVVYGPRFVSPAFAGILPHTDPSWTVEWKGLKGRPLTLENLYRQLYDRIQTPFAFSALVTFATMHGTALSLPPIYEEPVFEEQDRYWAFPPTKEMGGMGILFGVVADFSDTRHKQLCQDLRVGIYQNPFDTKGGLDAHCHALTLNHPLPAIADLEPHMVDDVLHLLSDTTLTTLKADIYSIDRVVAL